MSCVKVRPSSLHSVAILTNEYLLPFQWVPILAPTHTATKSGTGTYPIGDDRFLACSRRSDSGARAKTKASERVGKKNEGRLGERTRERL